MKRININISKDTPKETLTELYAALKTGKEKTSLKVSELYLLNEDIEKLNERYEELFKKVKASSNLSEKQIAQECEILSQKYLFEIQLFSELRKVDYEIKLAEIKARRRELKPWRRCWLWRLLFRPLTNRAQDIIEERAEVDADIIHKAAEEATDKEREKLLSDNDKKFIKRLMQDRLKAVINEADNADVKEAFDEPITASEVQENAGADTLKNDVELVQAQKDNVEPARENVGQLPGQLQLRLNELPETQARRPRPPRSCRK